VTKPILRGQWPGPAFDWPQNRWVPAMNPDVISPDGSAYVYQEDVEGPPYGPIARTRIRVVDVRSGTDRVLYSIGQSDLPIAWTNDGIYIVQFYYEATSTGLRLLNPATGAVHVITSEGTWSFVSGGAAWGHDPNIGLISGYSPHNVDRLDLATGKVTRWYSVADSMRVQVLTIDQAGRPIVAVASGPPRAVQDFKVLRLTGPSQAEPLFTIHTYIWDGTRWQSDTHGFWFVSGDIRGEVWLYADGTGLRRVALTGKDILAIAGPCR
jgi:hypothetical protein